jgi:hypothetical protein
VITSRMVALLSAAGLQTLVANTAQAQQGCPVCRTQGMVVNCQRSIINSSPEGSIGLVATVLDVKSEECGHARLRVSVQESTRKQLRGEIEVLVRDPCFKWAGKSGDTIVAPVQKSEDGSIVMVSICRLPGGLGLEEPLQ